VLTDSTPQTAGENKQWCRSTRRSLFLKAHHHRQRGVWTFTTRGACLSQMEFL